MATYRNKQDDTKFYGGEFKLKVSMDTIGGYDMGDDWHWEIYTGNKSIHASGFDVEIQMNI